MTNDGTLQLAGVINRLINQQIFIKSLIYSKSVPSVVEDTSINYSTYLPIYLTSKTLYAKPSNTTKSDISQMNGNICHRILEKTVYPSREELVYLQVDMRQTQIFASHLSLRIYLCFFFFFEHAFNKYV